MKSIKTNYNPRDRWMNSAQEPVFANAKVSQTSSETQT